MTNSGDNNDHFNMKPRRKAEFHTPPNRIKSKVGTGGLADDILNKAEALLENNTVDFRPFGELYLESITRGVDVVRDLPGSETSDEYHISNILFPAMQLKANGGMFHYNLVTSIADRMIQFLEVIEVLDHDALEIVKAFQTTIRAILLGQIRGDGGARGQELLDALNAACYRYLEKYPENRSKPV